MALGRNIIINWLIKSKAIKDDERELYEYALNSMVLLLSPAIISITIGCIMGIPVNGIFMVMPFLFLRKFSGGYHARHAWTCFVGSSILVTLFLWISTKINSGILLYVVTVISVVELCVFSPIQSGNRNIEGTVYGRSDGTSARSCSNTYKYYDGCKRYQSNNVKENGYDRAFFRAYSSSEFVTCEGVWSPDNFGNYQ